jgi:ubiquinone/menaquinone biosynthesis C-methylase UbiE
LAKDLFSNQASDYAKYRPTYPKELFEYIVAFVQNKTMAWDCATGNGQAAGLLSGYFEKVIATDISKAQLENAVQKNNISYQISPAEKTPFPDNSFDLITVATAYHWFEHKAFYKEATRVGKNNCVVAAWTYGSLNANDKKLNQIYQHFYQNIIKTYWEPERKHVDENYETVPFDFTSLPSNIFYSNYQWTKDQFIGYIETWSAVQKYKKINGESPLLQIAEELDQAWKHNELKEIIFSIYLRIGRIKKPPSPKGGIRTKTIIPSLVDKGK